MTSDRTPPVISSSTGENGYFKPVLPRVLGRHKRLIKKEPLDDSSGSFVVPVIGSDQVLSAPAFAKSPSSGSAGSGVSGLNVNSFASASLACEILMF